MRGVLGTLLVLASGAVLAVDGASATECETNPGVVLDLSTLGASGSINGASFQQISPQSLGGKISAPFVRIQQNGCEGGYNTSGRPFEAGQDLLNDPNYTRDLLLGDVPVVALAGVEYRQFVLDINEVAGSGALLRLDDLLIYQSNTAALITLYDLTPIYDLDGAGARHVLLNFDLNASSGGGDMVAYIPNSLFGPETYVYVYSRFHDSGDGFEEWSIARPRPDAPTANAGGPYLGAINTAITVDGSGSTDPDGDLLTYAWSFGDGGTGSGVATTHTYIAAGVYDVCLTVSDAGGPSEPNCTIAVAYDPEAGFVTGGGWFTSPQGAHKPDPDLAGRATFGFVSKYKKGATTPGASAPIGDTHFQFAAGDLNFNSASYEWLVVNQSGTNAQFKGVGTINGADDAAGNPYKFMVSATDGNPDLFRIRIWEEDAYGTKSDVYDNGVAQAIDGGSIVVQTGAKKAGGIAAGTAVSRGLSLSRPSPNPFSGTTQVRYSVNGPATQVEIAVFDVAGRRVRNLVSGVQGPGHYTASWDGRSDRGDRVAQGVYFLIASVGDQKQLVRVAHLR
jgi:PKD repeat protein